MSLNGTHCIKHSKTMRISDEKINQAKRMSTLLWILEQQCFIDTLVKPMNRKMRLSAVSCQTHYTALRCEKGSNESKTNRWLINQIFL